LAVGSGGKTTFSYANAFAVKCNGIISDAATPADAPALTTAKNAAGTTPTTLAIDYQRIYTLLAAVNATTGALTYSLAVGEDFIEGRAPTMADINFGNAADNDSHKAVVGFIIINNTTNAFTPGTTALDASGVTTRYFDHLVNATEM
jgi:multisubunit Na+/H+ antiporter MnhE subunit